MADKCPHCGSDNLGVEYADTIDRHGTDDPMYQELVIVYFRDCNECGEIGAVERV